MLKSLLISNVALIERAELNFIEGLNVLSGETGAGKSVLLSSIEFVLGGKADRSMIRSGQEFCSVRAEFCDLSEEIKGILTEMEIEPEETLVLSRKLTFDGKSSAKVNGCAVTLSMLKKLTSRLVDIHGQSEHFYLLDKVNQLKLLDRMGGEEVSFAKEKVKERLTSLKGILSQLKSIGGDEAERSRRMDILKFQLDEISAADLKDGEEQELTTFRDKMQHAERILTGLSAACDALKAEGGAFDTVQSAKHALSQIVKFDPALFEFSERLDGVYAELSDIGDSLERAAGEFDLDEDALERTENRLDEYKSIQKKYGGSLAAVRAYFARAEEEYRLLSDADALRAELSAKRERAEDELFAACLQLTEKRKKTAAELTKKVIEELKTLNISSARFEVYFEDVDRSKIDRATGEGLGDVEFLFSANAGEPLKELGKIISGGEMSRFMLAIKTQIAETEGIACALFDEIDAGIGGKTGKVVAEKLMRIARKIQIISVSHLSQIAAGADRQFLIEKQERDGRTYSLVRPLDESERKAELARMIAGEVNDLSLKHAEEMIRSANSYKNSLR